MWSCSAAYDDRTRRRDARKNSTKFIIAGAGLACHQIKIGVVVISIRYNIEAAVKFLKKGGRELGPDSSALR
jgi:hypothetical protein